jgi:hypothetical protein
MHTKRALGRLVLRRWGCRYGVQLRLIRRNKCESEPRLFELSEKRSVSHSTWIILWAICAWKTAAKNVVFAATLMLNSNLGRYSCWYTGICFAAQQKTYGHDTKYANANAKYYMRVRWSILFSPSHLRRLWRPLLIGVEVWHIFRGLKPLSLPFSPSKFLMEWGVELWPWPGQIVFLLTH